jgi:hypothetical protein
MPRSRQKALELFHSIEHRFTAITLEAHVSRQSAPKTCPLEPHQRLPRTHLPRHITRETFTLGAR